VLYFYIRIALYINCNNIVKIFVVTTPNVTTKYKQAVIVQKDL